MKFSTPMLSKINVHFIVRTLGAENLYIHQYEDIERKHSCYRYLRHKGDNKKFGRVPRSVFNWFLMEPMDTPFPEMDQKNNTFFHIKTIDQNGKQKNSKTRG